MDEIDKLIWIVYEVLASLKERIEQGIHVDVVIVVPSLVCEETNVKVAVNALNLSFQTQFSVWINLLYWCSSRLTLEKPIEVDHSPTTSLEIGDTGTTANSELLLLIELVSAVRIF